MINLRVHSVGRDRGITRSSQEPQAPTAGVRSVVRASVFLTALLVCANCGHSTPARSAGTAQRLRAPQPGSTWQWQLTGEVTRDADVDVVEMDLFDTPVETVAALNDAGAYTICYFSAGSYEPWRADAAAYPEGMLGTPMDGWPDERWVDIRRLDDLKTVLAARMDMCRQKGFAGAEPDNVDGWQNATGFDLSAADQIMFNRLVAELGHDRGLAVGLKNDVDQAGELEPYFDFAVNEECVRLGECQKLGGFVAAGKAVFHAEYGSSAESCGPPRRGFSSIVKRVELDRWVLRCPPT